jgi:hypothetical protein
LERKELPVCWDAFKAVIYLDDLVLLQKDPNYLKKSSGEIAQFLNWLGWTVNIDKSHLTPNRQFQCLGFIKHVCFIKERILVKNVESDKRSEEEGNKPKISFSKIVGK